MRPLQRSFPGEAGAKGQPVVGGTQLSMPVRNGRSSQIKGLPGRRALAG